MSTKEQIEEAKTDIKNVVRLSLGVVPLDDALVLLDALEAAERERDEAEDCVSAIAALCDQEMSRSFGYQDPVDENVLI